MQQQQRLQFHFMRQHDLSVFSGATTLASAIATTTLAAACAAAVATAAVATATLAAAFAATALAAAGLLRRHRQPNQRPMEWLHQPQMVL